MRARFFVPRFVLVVALLLATFVGVTAAYVLVSGIVLVIVDSAIGFDIADSVGAFLMLGGCIVPIIVPLFVTASIYGRVRRRLLAREITNGGDTVRSRTCPRCGYDQTGTAGRACPECGAVIAFARGDLLGPASAP